MQYRMFLLAAGLAAAGASHAATRANDVQGNLVTNGSMDYNGQSALGPNASGAPDGWTEFKTGPILGSHWYDANNMYINQFMSAGHADTRVLPYSPEGPLSYAASIYRGGEYRYYQNGGHGLQQTISGLTPGHTYELSFWAGAWSYYNYGDASWKVDFLGSSYTANVTTGYVDGRTCYGYFGNNSTQCYGNQSPGKSAAWKQFTTSFTAGEGVTTSNLKFAAYMPFVDASPFTYSLLVDGVVVRDVTPVPEPATVGLLTLGLGGVFLLRQRRNARR